MKNLLLIFLLTIISYFAFSQEEKIDSTRYYYQGLFKVSDAEKIDPTDILLKYSTIEVYKKNEIKDKTETVKIGPAYDDLIKLFAGNNKDRSPVFIHNLSGLNFAAIKALQKASLKLEDNVLQLEESQEIINKQTADIADMQNNLLQLMGEIEELKQKNIDMANDLDNFKMEINKNE
ncbi:MAG: hypothetical protein JEZ09_11520 [Salinivirgaceae bacterium]|nr:hypothetical protein [Salinivirgaceae bacterium]